MNNNLIFFLSGALIVVLSVAVLSTGVVINKIIGVNSSWYTSYISYRLSPPGSSFSFSSSDWATLNCQLLDDKYKELEEDWEKEDDADLKKQRKKFLDHFGQVLNSCNRRKAFYGLEYSALIIDICAGFICSVLGLLHYLNEGKSFATKSGLIGLVFGAVGFVMTLVYLIYSILVYTKDGDSIPKLDSDGSFATLSNGEYKNTYYKENDIFSMIAKYSEYGKKQYNYNKEIYQNYNYESSSEYYHLGGCISSTLNFEEKFSSTSQSYGPNSKPCLKLYREPFEDYTNKNLSDRWLTSIILTALIMLCTICLALFGFLLFKNKEGSTSGEVKVA